MQNRSGGKRCGDGEGSVFEEHPGRWVGFLSLGFVAQEDGTQKRLRKKFTGTTQVAVLSKIVDARKSLLTGGVVPRDVETLELFFPRWLESIKTHVRPKTWHEYTRHWERYIKSALGLHKLNKLTPAHVESMTRGMIARGLSPKTARLAHGTLRAALHQAERHGLVSRNVASIARLPMSERKEVKPLAAPDAARVLKAFEGSRFEAIFALMLYLGLRIGEALGLSWDDIDFARRTLTIRRALIRTGGEWKTVAGRRKQVGTRLQFTEPKTSRSRRTLPIPQPLMDALVRNQESQRQLAYEQGDAWQDSGLVCTNTLGGQLEPRVVGKQLDKILASLGLGHVNVHTCRHTAASLLIACGYNLGQVQQILGHSNVALTADLYGHLLTDAAREPLDKMASMLAPAEGVQNPVATSTGSQRPN